MAIADAGGAIHASTQGGSMTIFRGGLASLAAPDTPVSPAMMKTFAVGLALTASLAFAPGASAFVAGVGAYDHASGTGTFGPGNNNFQIAATTDTDPATCTRCVGPGGLVEVGGTDGNGDHAYGAFVECLQVDPSGTSAGMLARLDATVEPSIGEPAALFGVLIHVTDPDPLNMP